MIKHLVKEEVIANSVNPISQEMEHEGDVLGANPKFGNGDGLGDAHSETVGGTDQKKVRKRKNTVIREAGQPAEKEGMSKDAIYRANKKAALQKVEEKINDLKAKIEELERETMQLKWDKVGLEKQVLEVKAVAEKEMAVAEKERAVAEKERAVAEKEKLERMYLQRELEIANQMVQMQSEELQIYKGRFNFLMPMQGSLRQRMLGKLAQRRATWIEWMATFLINPSTKLASLQGREELLNSISSSIMSLFKYTTTKIDAKRRLAVRTDDWEKDFYRIENLCILNSYFGPLRDMGSNWVVNSFIRDEIYRTLGSYFESQKGKYDKLMALARQIRASIILDSYAGNLDCDLIDHEPYASGWMRGSFYHELFSCFKSTKILRSIRWYAESLRVEKKPSCIMQLSFAWPIEMWSGILQNIYKPLRKSGVWNLYELRSFYRLLVVKRGLVARIRKIRTLGSHFDPPKGRGDLVILVKNSARSVWKFRCATQATRKPVIVGDLVDDQIVFYEGDLPTGAYYRSEIAIVGLGLATWVELESSN